MNSEYKIHTNSFYMNRYWYLKLVTVFKKLVVGHVYKRVVHLLLILSCRVVYYMYDEV
jgi:hypothetical protein